jgi:restriction system protein
VGIALAIVSWMIFHVLAAQTTPVAGVVSIPQFTMQTLTHFTAFFLEFAIPFCLMVGVLVAVLRRRRARTIMTRSHDNPKTAIAAMTWRLEMGGPGPDGGVDLVLHKDGKRFLCQCKHWKTRAVGGSVVHELQGAITAQEADGGYVITGGHFTPGGGGVCP